MTQISGTVQYLQSKQVPNKNKPGQSFTFWTATINGTPINVGFNSGKDKKPVFTQGMEVTIETTPGYKDELKYVDGSIRVGSLPSSNNNTNAPSGNSANATPHVVTGDRELSIIRQSALKAAVETVNAMEGIKSLQDRIDAIIATASTYTLYSSGKLAQAEATKLVSVKTKKKDVDPDTTGIEDEVNG